MNSHLQPPIKRKLTLAILSVCTVVLLLACGLVAAYQWYDFRKATIRDTAILADVLASNTQAALTFQDEAAAHLTLGALRADPHVLAASLYDMFGHRLAAYSKSADVVVPQMPEKDGYRFEPSKLMVFRPIVLHDKRIGTIFIETNLQAIYDRLRLFAVIAFVILIGSLLVALAISGRLLRPISEPILALADSARAIADRNDYTVRANPRGSREIAVLAEAFNQMLEGIQEREKSLRNANVALQLEVAERKSAEERVQAQLSRLELLDRITRAISERQDLKSIFQVVIRTLEDRLPVDFCCVCLMDHTANALFVAGIGARSDGLAAELSLAQQTRIEIDENGLGRCVQGNLVYESDIRDSKFAFPARLAGGGLASLVIAPLLTESQVFGVLIAARKQAASFSSGECEFLKQLSEHVALAANQAQLNAALQQAYDDLRQTQQVVMQQERLRALGQMASGIAHDINNAISPAALYTESLLESEPNLTARGKDYLGTIQRALDDVAKTVSRMREFYRQKEEEIKFAPVPLNRLVREVLDLSKVRWQDMPQQRGIVIDLTTELAPDLPLVLGVESEIREALVNLVFNAVDAMPKGGRLSLRTRPIFAQASGAVRTGTDAVCVEVCDTGIGMDEDTQRRCLEPFYTTKGERGTGLGLAMVYGTMRRHAGDLEIESAPARGTTMRLSFQRAPSGSFGPADTPPAPMVLSRLKVLVIDDDPLLIKSLRDILETDGHIVTTANGGQAGIDAFRSAVRRSDPFAITITDLGMPYVDGRKVASALKAESSTTPVILLTGWGQRLVSEGDIPMHVDRVISKPPKLRELREALASCFRQTG